MTALFSGIYGNVIIKNLTLENPTIVCDFANFDEENDDSVSAAALVAFAYNCADALIENADEILSEEMRVLYVALTRAKEKVFITGIAKDFEKEKQKKEELINIYKQENSKINPILVKKYKNYLDWIELVYLKNQVQQSHQHQILI